MKNLLRVGMLGAALMTAQGAFATDHKVVDPVTAQMEKVVRRELITMPFYSLFDSLSFKVEGDTVTLMGKVRRPTLKTDAENLVKKVEGVEKVVNEIRVLPLSPEDDRLRFALYNTIYGHSALDTLAIRAMPPIHIIVENGHVTLEGVVATEMQKNIAGIQANTVSGLFSVTNNLRVEE